MKMCTSVHAESEDCPETAVEDNESKKENRTAFGVDENMINECSECNKVRDLG